MKKRNPFIVYLLTFVTVFIYYFYWLYATRNEMVKKGAKIPPIWIIFLPLLLIMVALLQLVVHFSTQNGGTIAVTNIASVLFGFAAILGIPASIYFLYKYCGGIEKVTKGQMSRTLSLSLFIILAILSSIPTNTGSHVLWIGAASGLISSLWPAIIQNSFNQVKR